MNQHSNAKVRYQYTTHKPIGFLLECNESAIRVYEGVRVACKTLKLFNIRLIENILHYVDYSTILKKMGVK